MTKTFTLTENQGDTLAGAFDAALKGRPLTEDERAALEPIAAAFRRNDILIRVATEGN